MPRAVQRPHPPIWLAARGPKSIARAARNGYHLMGTGGVDQQQTYDAALREAGQNPSKFNIAQLRTVFVAPRRAAARDAAQAGAHYVMSCYGKWFVEANDLPGDAAFGAKLPPPHKLRDTETAAIFGAVTHYRHAGRGDHDDRRLSSPHARYASRDGDGAAQNRLP